MAVGTGEIKLTYELFSRLILSILGRKENKKLQELMSQAYQELLKGDNADLNKVVSTIRKLRANKDDSPGAVRLESLYNQARIFTGSVKAMMSKAEMKAMARRKQAEKQADIKKKIAKIISHKKKQT